MRKVKTSQAYQEGLRLRLQNPDYAAEYLQAAMEDGEPSVYLLALRDIAEALGMNEIAAAAGIPRESLYRALSPKGNPRWSTLSAILRATGIKLEAARAAA